MLIRDKLDKFDPRTLLPPDELELACVRAAPKVARAARGGDTLGLAAGVIGALALGAVTLASLTSQRTAPPPDVAAVREQTLESEPMPTAPIALPEEMPAPEADAAPAASANLALPMVIDNSAGFAQSAAAAGDMSVEAEGGQGLAVSAGVENGAPARARPPINPSTTVVQGAIIPAVLETALNSEMPGPARAIVSRDVRSFDGSSVLIPRGSRLIGQYRASSSPGQSRAFVSWSRLIRPDGVSIDLASPALDRAGAAGVPGSVDRHFFQNFGSSLLLSVFGVLPAVTGNSPTVVIGANAAQTAASQQADGRIPPTIRVPVGTPIQVFTARDLSF